MVNAPITPIALAQVGGVLDKPAMKSAGPAPAGNIFDQMLGRAVDALNNVSESEWNANKLIDGYVAGKVELSDVMVATSKMNVAVQLAVTTITTTVSTFKEITQISI
jgi:flagellar hook-basal body complex protein FliE